MSDYSEDERSQSRSGAETEDSENYQKYELREHILKRPENYIGSTNRHEEEIYVVKNDRFELKTISYVPGLYKIFDEILVNAADNCQRDPPTKKIQVEINQEEGFVSVWNDGKGIPISQKYDEKDDETYWIPEFIFGHLLTSSNYDDSKKRTTGGRNGFGAKLANIYSKTFIVECISINPEDGKYYEYVQTFTDHMENIGKPKIKEIKNKKPKTSTMIKFYPDCALFAMEKLDDDIIALFTKRVYDLAGCLKNCTVFLNGSKIQIKNFDEYCKRYLPNDADFLSIDVNDRWKIGVSSSDDGFSQVSFVNSVFTGKGGTHVDYVANQITKYIVSKLAGSKNDVPINAKLAKQFLFVFVICLIENPSFDSQTKDTLTLQVKEFGSKCEIPETFLKKIMKTDIPTKIKEMARAKQKMSMNKMGGRKTARIHGIDKLVDANEAGKSKSSQCTLILTEGDSAKSMAVTGLSVIGRDFYGVFPLRGKLLNTRDVSAKKLADNEEIQNLMKIMALKPKAKYDSKESLNDLRYGSIMIMADQDQDGSHIKGLIINFIHSMWPDLIKRPGFLCEFITPIVKVFKKTKDDTKNKKVKGESFYTLPEFIEWKKQHNDAKGYSVKYYKGLATSNDDETKEYFTDFKRHKIKFEFSGQNDEERIQLAFDKKLADQRKTWLAGLDPDTTYLGQDTPTITYTDFVDKELILFSNYANVRSIPSVVDGLKPGQRKVLWVSLKQNIRRELKVNQLAGKVSQLSAYHHGETSLAETIVGMAQTFVGSNNINLFYPSGQFGTRLHGGKDAGSSRYIYTRLNNITRTIFHKDDDQLLEYLTDEGIPIEPKYYVPVIPMVLVNGSEGIGVGWSSSIPCFNPLDIIKNIRHKINNEEMEEMLPWYSGFIGEIKRVDGKSDEEAKKWNVSGIVNVVSDEMIEITELPIGEWTDDYKKKIDNLFTGEKDKNTKKKKGGKGKGEEDEKPTKFEPKISDLKEYHTNETVHFEIYVNQEQMENIMKEGLDKFFHLTKTINATNMTLFSPEGHIKQYKSAEQIIEDFYPVRIKLYEERKAAILDDLDQICRRLTNQARFIKEFIDGELELRNIPKKTILLNLKVRKYDLFDLNAKKMPKKVAEDAVDVENDEEEENDELPGEESKKKKKSDESKDDPEIETLTKGYNYLLSMKIWSLTRERYLKLLKQKEEAEQDIERIMKKQPHEMWLEDLDALEKEYIEFEGLRKKKREENINDAKMSKKKSKSKVTIQKVKPRVKKEEPKAADQKKPGETRSDVDSQADENEPGSKPAKSPSKKAATKAGGGEKKPRKPRATKKKNGDESTTDTESAKPVSVKKEKKPSTKKASTSDLFEESDDSESVEILDSDDDDDSAPAKQSFIVENRERRSSQKKKFSSSGDDDDDDESLEDDDDDDDDDFQNE